MLCVEHSGVRPDMLVLGKALSGGIFPVSISMFLFYHFLKVWFIVFCFQLKRHDIFDLVAIMLNMKYRLSMFGLVGFKF